jgi:hypothetical protein
VLLSYDFVVDKTEEGIFLMALRKHSFPLILLVGRMIAINQSFTSSGVGYG